MNLSVIVKFSCDVVYIVIICAAITLYGCAAGNPVGGAGQELVCADGTAWVYIDGTNSNPDGYVFRENGVFFYVIRVGERWSADNCAMIGGRYECGYSGTWTANGSFLTLTHEDGRQQRQIRYAMQGNDIMMLYDNGEMAPPSNLIKIGGVHI